jgi:hypothetical protein
MSRAPECDESTPLLQRGTYQAPLPTDIRSPCPIVNSLANHGYIPRDGRNVRASEMKAALDELGLASTISTLLTYGAYLEHHDNPATGLWAFVRNPLAYALQRFALRDVGQTDPDGSPYLNLDQLDRHGAIEHDVSLSRRDWAQGDNKSPQKDLIAEFLASSSDGNEITVADFARFRSRRLEQQRKDNPRLVFGPEQHGAACAEGALIQRLFGNSSRGYAMPVSYVKAVFEEERFPFKEGWERRSWWLLGLGEVLSQIRVVKKAVGPVE